MSIKEELPSFLAAPGIASVFERCDLLCGRGFLAGEAKGYNKVIAGYAGHQFRSAYVEDGVPLSYNREDVPEQGCLAPAL